MHEDIPNKHRKISEILDRRKILHFEEGALARCAVELARDGVQFEKQISPILSDLSIEQLIKLTFAKATERITGKLLAYLNAELTGDKERNFLGCETNATDSERLMANSGITAFSAILTYHAASHYVLAEMLGQSDEKSPTQMDDDELEELLIKCCRKLKKTFERLNERIPETLIPGEVLRNASKQVN